jgi:hypothetical protein
MTHPDVFLLLSLLAAPTPPGPVPAAYDTGFGSVTERDLKAWLEFLASPELEGREAGTRGYDVAARYVATVLEGLGVPPLGGSYFQPFDLVRRKRDLDRTEITVEMPARGGGPATTFKIPLKEQLSLRSSREIDWSDPWVFVGHGEGPESDAPDDFAGLDLEGKVVLVLPPEGKKSGEAKGALATGAKRIVVISDDRAGRRSGLESPELPRHLLERWLESGTEPDIVYVSRAVADRLLDLSGTSSAKLLAGPGRPRPFAFDGPRIRIKAPWMETVRPTRNVVGWLEGSDPVLRREVVVLGAHLDHIGARGAEVFRGADDDASGVSAILGAAKAFQANPTRPRRSVLFIFYAAEETGLHGSRYFVDYPPFPLERVALAIQLDMIGRNEESPPGASRGADRPEDNVRSIHVVGSKRHSRELDPWVQRLNELVGLSLEYDEERVFERSDHYQFASHGIPVVFFFSGFHPDYHKSTDTPDKINYAKVVSVARLVFALAYEVADREKRLTVNRL